KELLLKSVGMGSVPVIRVEDADHGGNRNLLLSHAHDGRDLHLENAERTLGYVHPLWGREVVLETMMNSKKATLTHGEKGVAAKAAKGSANCPQPVCRRGAGARWFGAGARLRPPPAPAPAGLHGARRYNPPPCPSTSTAVRAAGGRSRCSPSGFPRKSHRSAS